jgi:hypothetical protein
MLTPTGTVANDTEKNASVIDGLKRLDIDDADTANTTVYGSSYANQVSFDD